MTGEKSTIRRQGKSVRRCSHGWEYGYWLIDDRTGEKLFTRVGIARTMDAALRRLEAL